jgi:hypothetical protein
MITYFFIAPKKPFWAQSILRLRLFLPKATGWQNGSNGWNGWERIFIPPAADKDEPKASQSPFLSV